jgi:hypothetical protein
LTAAVALVRAAGLRSEAENQSGTQLTFLDLLRIPIQLRGYVSVATSKGLLQGDALFRPDAPMTRSEMAQSIATLQRIAIE